MLLVLCQNPIAKIEARDEVNVTNPNSYLWYAFPCSIPDRVVLQNAVLIRYVTLPYDLVARYPSCVSLVVARRARAVLVN